MRYTVSEEVDESMQGPTEGDVFEGRDA